MRYFAVLILFCAFFISCKNKEAVIVDIPPRSADKLVAALIKGIPNIHYYKAKGDVSIKMEDVDRSVNCHIRSISDSALWVSVTPALGIEVARMVMTNDSLKFLEKINDKYFMGTVLQAEERFDMVLDVSLFQEAFLGLPIGLDQEQKYRSDRENGQYVLTSKGPKRFIRIAEEMTPSDTTNETDEEREVLRAERIMRQAQNKNSIVTKYWIDPITMLPTRVLLADLSLGQQADIHYGSREEVDGLLLPAKLDVLISDQFRDARVQVVLSRVSTQGPLKLSFRVPDKYEPLDS